MSKNSFQIFLGTYNASSWIENLVSSLESQDYGKFEVNIVDNSSSDNTVEIIKNHLSNRNNRNLYKLYTNEKNVGAISSFLDQLNIFDCEWLFMIHQDDIYHSNHISTLANAISEVSEDTSVVFTAMNRVDSNGKEIFNPPTLAPKIKTSKNLENFCLALQINPVNFPACAIRISSLKNINTSRHTTAFNDTEIMLRLMAQSNIKYLPIETMHYRIYEGNAASITNSNANNLATLIGMNEVIHSNEFRNLVNSIKEDAEIKMLVDSFKSAIDIRISDLEIRNFANFLISESLVRIFGYKNSSMSNYLIESLKIQNLHLGKEIAKNLSTFIGSELVNNFESSSENSVFSDAATLSTNRNLFLKLLNFIPLNIREKFFRMIVSSPIFLFAKRPFIRVWRQKPYK